MDTKEARQLNLNYCLIWKDSYTGWSAPLSLYSTYTVERMLAVVRGALGYNADLSDMKKADALKSAYYPKGNRFLKLEKTLLNEGVSPHDLLVCTDCEATEEQQEYLKGVLIIMNQRGWITLPDLDEHSIIKARVFLAIRALIQKLPYIGPAVDALLFGKQ